ncbi:dipeptidase [Microbacterium sp. No. 7]|uniref:dipeptidase n=1 Tax=Microbacterium sp. No. 7 TaxID=1714373 RepID=UPI0006D16BFE|nr:membrane dipeptidase [Microbacterium sp. No. 7]ALJ22305.1 diguanylate cyclase [Microbacterium sp. No. 7]
MAYVPAKPHHYESYPFLQRGQDFSAVDLVDPSTRLSTYDAGLSESEAARVERLLADNLVVSFHDHPQLLPLEPSALFEYLRTQRDFTAYGELKHSRLTALFDNLVGSIGMGSPSGWKWHDVITALGMRLADLAYHDDEATVIRTVQDIHDAKATGRVGFIMGAESTECIENEVDRLDVLYGLGVRQMGLTYGHSNSLGSGQKERRDGGLTALGRRAVERMNKLGILVDVAHSGDQTSLDAIETSAKPIAITHSGCRSLWPVPRLKPDEVLKACAERGGVLGIMATPLSTISLQHRTQSIESVMDHFVHAVDLMGIEHVTFGLDTLYGDHAGLHHNAQRNVDIKGMYDPGDLEYTQVSFVDGVENLTESYPNVTAWLVKHGYSDSEIAAVLGGNILRLLEDVWH